MTEPVAVTVVIIARDEEAEIEACLTSVAWARERIVVEWGSSDATVTRATAAGARILHHPFSSIGAQRNVGIAAAEESWVLVLDADERGSDALGDAVRRAIASGAFDAWRIVRRNRLFGADVRYGSWGRDRPVRLFRQPLRFDARPVHSAVVTNGAVGLLDAVLVHDPYRSLDEWFEKIVTYGREWATGEWRAGRRGSFAEALARPVARFLRSLVVHSGWRDGARGLLIAMMSALSVATRYTWLWWLTRGAKGESRS